MDLRVFFDLLKLSERTNESLHRKVIIVSRSIHSSLLLLFVGGCLLFYGSDPFLFLSDHLLTIFALLGALWVIWIFGVSLLVDSMRRATVIAVVLEAIHTVWSTIVRAVEIVVWIIGVVAVVRIAWGLSDIDWAG